MITSSRTLQARNRFQGQSSARSSAGPRTTRQNRAVRWARSPAILVDVLDAFVEILASLYARLVGRPWQRRRAGRLINQGRVRSILFDADEGVLRGRSVDGVAEVSEKRLRIHDVDLWVHGIEGPSAEGPLDPFSQDGTFRPSDGNLTFEPPTRIYRLRLHNEATVRWAVLAFQAGEALSLLGFDEDDASPINQAR